MHDIWNPWHGCTKISEGCENCYMYFLDKARDMDGACIYRTKTGFDYPLSRERNGAFRVKSGELIRVCMTSDFFLPEADEWRAEAWSIMWQRRDVKFYLLTKRAQRIRECLPPDWGDGWENVILNVTCENQRRADERIPILLSIPAKHRGIMCAPFIGRVSISDYLQSGQLEQVICGGENYGGARPCSFDWVRSLGQECREANVKFCFIETGTSFIKDGRLYKIKNKQVQAKMAHRSGVSFPGKAAKFRLFDALGRELEKDELYTPRFRRACLECGSQPICNGCADCGKCGVPRGSEPLIPAPPLQIP